MDLGSFLISAGLFYVFIPGVFFHLPAKASKATVVAVHSVLFAVVVGVVMKYYWTGSFEFMTNYGQSCPNGYVEGTSKTGVVDCVPTGHQTYPTSEATGQPVLSKQ